jgi:hypothetical protein
MLFIFLSFFLWYRRRALNNFLRNNIQEEVQGKAANIKPKYLKGKLAEL